MRSFVPSKKGFERWSATWSVNIVGHEAFYLANFILIYSFYHVRRTAKRHDKIY